MSKFIEKIEHRATEQVKAEYSRLKYKDSLNVDVVKTFDEHKRLYEYDFSVKFGKKMYCRTQDINVMYDNIIHELKEEIYGDIRNRILRLERAIYGQDNDRALMEIRGIIQEVFE